MSGLDHALSSRIPARGFSYETVDWRRRHTKWLFLKVYGKRPDLISQTTKLSKLARVSHVVRGLRVWMNNDLEANPTAMYEIMYVRFAIGTDLTKLSKHIAYDVCVPVDVDDCHRVPCEIYMNSTSLMTYGMSKPLAVDNPYPEAYEQYVSVSRYAEEAVRMQKYSKKILKRRSNKPIKYYQAL